MKLLRLVRNVAIALFAALLFVTVFFGGPSDSNAVTAPARPVASFSVQASGLSVTVNASESSAADGHTLTRYEWDWNYEPNSASFDVESTTESPTPDPHPYAASGTYIVGLRVVQNNGLKSEVAWQAVSIDGVAPAAATEPALAAPAEACPGSYQVKLFSNDGGNLFPEGFLSDQPETMRGQVADGAKADPRVLQTYYNASPLGQANPIANTADIAPIQDGGCYTELGKKAYDEWVVLWRVTRLTPDSLPETGTNTGAVPNGPAYQETGLIPGGPGMRVEYVDANGNVIIVHKVRLPCGNVVTTYTIILASKPEGAPSIVTPPPVSETPTPGTSPETPPGSTTPTTPSEKCEWPTPYGSPPYCKDSPDNNVLLNTNVPAQVRGPGNTPIGVDPGPAAAPTDSPTGCRGSCDNHATSSAPAANPAMTQSVVPDLPQVQNPTTANSTIPSDAGIGGNAGGSCELDEMGIPVNGCS